MERVPDSVWELPLDFDWTPQAVADYIEENYETARETDGIGTMFSLAAGLYWHCVDWHGGMMSDRYRISCSLDYSPGPCEYSPGTVGDEEIREEYAEGGELEDVSYVYNELARSAE